MLLPLLFLSLLLELLLLLLVLHLQVMLLCLHLLVVLCNHTKQALSQKGSIERRMIDIIRQAESMCL